MRSKRPWIINRAGKRVRTPREVKSMKRWKKRRYYDKGLRAWVKEMKVVTSQYVSSRTVVQCLMPHLPLNADDLAAIDEAHTMALAVDLPTSLLSQLEWDVVTSDYRQPPMVRVKKGGGKWYQYPLHLPKGRRRFRTKG